LLSFEFRLLTAIVLSRSQPRTTDNKGQNRIVPKVAVVLPRFTKQDSQPLILNVQKVTAPRGGRWHATPRSFSDSALVYLRMNIAHADNSIVQPIYVSQH
jgi:hypothetical protein